MLKGFRTFAFLLTLTGWLSVFTGTANARTSTLHIHDLKVHRQSFYDNVLAIDINDLLEIVSYSGSITEDDTAALTLGDLIKTALQNNQMIEVVKQMQEQSRSQLGQAQSDYLPHLAVTGRYFYTERKDSASQVQSGGETSNTSIQTSDEVETDDIVHGAVNLSQLIYDFGKTTGAISEGRANLLASTAKLQRQVQQIIFRVKESYYQVLEKQRLIDIAEETVRSFSQHLEQSRVYYKAGVRTKIDVINAEVELSNARLALLRAEYGLATAKAALEQILGTQPNDGRYTVSADRVNLDNLLQKLPDVPAGLDNLLETATSNRPDLVSLTRLKEAAEANLQSVTGDYWPRITAEAAYNDYDTELSLYKDSWEAGIALRWELFSGMKTNKVEAEAKSRLVEARARLNDQKLLVIKEVTDSFLKTNEHYQSVHIALQTHDLAKQNVELAEKRYRSGAYNVIEFNDAQLNLTKIRNELVVTYYGYLTSLAGIEYATGRPLPAANGHIQ